MDSTFIYRSAIAVTLAVIGYVAVNMLESTTKSIDRLANNLQLTQRHATVVDRLTASNAIIIEQQAKILVDHEDRIRTQEQLASNP